MIVGKTDFSDQFRNVIECYKRIGYYLNAMLHASVINTITTDNTSVPFHFTPVDRAFGSVCFYFC